MPPAPRRGHSRFVGMCRPSSCSKEQVGRAGLAVVARTSGASGRSPRVGFSRCAVENAIPHGPSAMRGLCAPSRLPQRTRSTVGESRHSVKGVRLRGDCPRARPSARNRHSRYRSRGLGLRLPRLRRGLGEPPVIRLSATSADPGPRSSARRTDGPRRLSPREFPFTLAPRPRPVNDPTASMRAAGRLSGPKVQSGGRVRVTAARSRGNGPDGAVVRPGARPFPIGPQ